VAEPRLIVATGVPDSPARTEPAQRQPFRIGAVQQCWRADAGEHEAALAGGVAMAAAEGAELVCLQELTLSRYFASEPDDEEARRSAEPVDDGPTASLARRMAAQHGIFVHASLYERSDEDGRLGYNTAICVAPGGEIVARTRKLHIPLTAGYHEDRYFRPGDTGYPVIGLGDARFAFPTCYDQWFPEVARAYSLGGAEVIVYPTAIGSEPDHPSFDTEPLWERVITANGVANGTFMVTINRVGREGNIEFYGSSFISDPYGRVLVQAPRGEPAVLVADLDLDQRRDWLALFPLLSSRRPDTYDPLVQR